MMYIRSQRSLLTAKAMGCPRRATDSWLAGLVCLASAIGALFAQPPEAQGQPSPSIDRLDQYLQELALDDLRIVHLQQRLDETAEAPQRTIIGRRLAGLFAEKLVRVSDDPTVYDETINDVKLLLAEVPNADSEVLQVMLLQAEYLRAEEHITAWLVDRRELPERDQAYSILRHVSTQLATQQQALEQKLKRMNENILETEDEKLIESLEEEQRRTQVVEIRASYYAGWANYYAGIFATDGKLKDEFLNRGNTSFRRFLGIGADDDLNEVTADWLDLLSGLQARGVAGLAMVLVAQNQPDTSEHFFQMLLGEDVAQNVRQEAPLLRLHGYLNTNQLELAQNLATANVRTFGVAPNMTQTQFCVTLIRYSAAPPPGISPPKELLTTGIEGLVRLRQFRQLQELDREFALPLDEPQGFYQLWAKANLRFAAGEESMAMSDFEDANRWFSQAVSDSANPSDARSLGHCHYQFGWSLFNAKQFDQAADRFERAMMLLEAIDKETAANAAWKRYESLKALADSEPRYLVLAVETLRAICVRFPQHRLAGTAQYHLTQLERSKVSPEETIAALEAIGPSESNYITARYELCTLTHQVWNSAHASGEATTDHVQTVLNNIERYQSAAADEPPARRMRSLLLAVDIALRSNPRDLALARDSLNRAAAFARELGASHSVMAEFRYQQFQLARIEGNNDQVAQHAAWLAENAADSIYGQSALVSLARTADEALKTAEGASRRPLLEDAKAHYERLANAIGTDKDTLQQNRNARVSLYRLGQIRRELGETAQATEHFEQLLTFDEKNESYLRLAGLGNFETGRYARALEQWRLLVGGLPRGSDGWLEAKYHVIACLEQTAPDEAREVLEQFRVLYPVGKAGSWDERLSAIERRL